MSLHSCVAWFDMHSFINRVRVHLHNKADKIHWFYPGPQSGWVISRVTLQLEGRQFWLKVFLCFACSSSYVYWFYFQTLWFPPAVQKIVCLGRLEALKRPGMPPNETKKESNNSWHKVSTFFQTAFLSENTTKYDRTTVDRTKIYHNQKLIPVLISYLELSYTAIRKFLCWLVQNKECFLSFYLSICIKRQQ